MKLLHSPISYILLAQPFELQCVGDVTPSGLIEVSCTTERVLQSLTCTVDDGSPEICECFSI